MMTYTLFTIHIIHIYAIDIHIHIIYAATFMDDDFTMTPTTTDDFFFFFSCARGAPPSCQRVQMQQGRAGDETGCAPRRAARRGAAAAARGGGAGAPRQGARRRQAGRLKRKIGVQNVPIKRSCEREQNAEAGGRARAGRKRADICASHSRYSERGRLMPQR